MKLRRTLVNKSISLRATARYSSTAQIIGPAVDASRFIGRALLELNSSATEVAGQTADIRLQHCETPTGTFVDSGQYFQQITSATGSFQVLEIDADALRKYVRVAIVPAGPGMPAVTCGVALDGYVE